MEHVGPALLVLLKRPCIFLWSVAMIMIAVGWMVKMALASQQGPPHARVALATCIMLSVALALSDVILSLAAVVEGKVDPFTALINSIVGMGAIIFLAFIVFVVTK